MTRLSQVLAAVIFIFIVAGFSSASDIYIAQNAAGANTGLDCNDAHSAAWFNSSSNWGSGSGQIGAGTTAHLCGTFTSELSVQGSGTSGNPVTILFESGAKIQVTPGCDSNGCLNLGGNSYITVDGGLNRPCGWNTAANDSEGSCNGQIENMLYGSSGATCPGGACTTQTQTGNLIQGSGSNIEIRNLQAGPSYIHTSTGNNGNDTNGTGCISDSDGSNWNLHDNKIHDGSWCVNITPNGNTVSGITMSNNEMYNNSHMVALAIAGGGSLNGFTFNGNYLHDMYMWDTSSDTWHADAIHLFGDGNAGDSATNLVINNNIFGGNTGGDVTGQLFMEGSGGAHNVVIFNNLFNITTSPNLGSSNYIFGPAQCVNCSFYNNTSNGGGTTLGLGYSTYVVSMPAENNVIEGAYVLANVSTSYVTLSPFDYNAYGPNSGGIWVCHGSFINSLSSWQSACGEGVHSLYNGTSLSLDSSFKPQSGSPVIGAGVNVCNVNPTFCTNYPAIKNDIAGNARPTSGAWDIGAFQFSTSNAPAPPTGLGAVVQ